MEIGKKDVIWNFFGTFMRVASRFMIFPIVMKLLPKEDVSLWGIFIAVGGMVTLLDFGFSNSFTRNITYIFSGVKELRKEGYSTVNNEDKTIDYGLLKSVIAAMRRYYGILAVVFTVVFIVASPFYLKSILVNYHGDKQQVWIAWFVYGVLVAYQLYTYYYGSILSGRGKVKQLQQITIIGQSCGIISTVIFIVQGYGIISLAIGQLVTDIVNRTLCYKAFYDKVTKHNLKTAAVKNVADIMKIMSPNALKIGLTTAGGFMISKAISIIAPLYISLDSELASYTITKQMIDVIISLAFIWFGTYYPKITLLRVNNDTEQIKRMYLKAKFSLVVVFLVCGFGLIFVGPPLVSLIHSRTPLLSTAMIAVFLIISFLETNHGLSAQLILTKNEVPFAGAAIISGIVTVGLLFISLKLTTIGIWGMILAPGIAQICYQNWKWPLVVIKELHIKPIDYFNSAITTIKTTLGISK